MIFVTVGTHEQQFDRLIKEVDRLCKEKIIQEEVIIQTGYSSYMPLYCKSVKFMSYQDIKHHIKQARIVVTHGGPASFLSVIEVQKIPVVVPRQTIFGEHVNNHQLDFAMKLKNRGYNIIVLDEIENLSTVLINYNDEKSGFLSNNAAFNENLLAIIEETLGDF